MVAAGKIALFLIFVGTVSLVDAQVVRPYVSNPYPIFKRFDIRLAHDRLAPENKHILNLLKIIIFLWQD